VPAAAVIPAPIAYIKVVAVKTLVVEILLVKTGRLIEIVLVVTGINPNHSIGNTVVCSEVLL
jgi:hypothetical protein